MKLTSGLVSVALLLTMGAASYAAIPSKSPSARPGLHDGVLLDTNFQVGRELLGRDNQKSRVSARVISDLANKDWVRVGETAGGLVVLAYVQPLEGEQVQVHFRVIDASGAEDKAVASSKVVTTYGAKASVETKEVNSDRVFSVEVTPSRVRYDLGK